MPNSNELNDAISTASKFYEYFLGKPQQPTTQDIPLGMPPASNPEQGQFANIQRPFDNTYMDTLIGGGESDSMPQLPQSAGTINGQSVPQFQVDKGKIHETKLMSKLIDLARDKSRTEQLQLQMEAQRMQDEATRRQDEFSQANGNHMMGLMAAGQKPFELQRPAGASGVPTGADQVMLQLMGKDVNAPWDMAKAEMALQSQFQKNQILQDKINQKAKLDADKLRAQDVMQQRLLDFQQKKADADRASKEGMSDDKLAWLREKLGIEQPAKDKANQAKADEAQAKEYRAQVTKLMNGQEIINDNTGKPVYLRDAVRDIVSGAGNRDVSEESVISGINQEKQEYFNLLNNYHQKDAEEIEDLIFNLQEARKQMGERADASWWTKVAQKLSSKDPVVAKAIMLQGINNIQDRYHIDEILSGNRTSGSSNTNKGIIDSIFTK